MCKANRPGRGLPRACEQWDLHDNLDSRGAILFRRFASRALTNPVSSALPRRRRHSTSVRRRRPGEHAARPEHRPPDGPAGASATRWPTSTAPGIPLDAPLGDWQYEKRGDEKIPIHGGPGDRRRLQRDQRRLGRQRRLPERPPRLQLRPGRRAARASAPTCGRFSPTRSRPARSRRGSPTRRGCSRKKQWVDIPFCADQLRAARVVQRIDVGGGTVAGSRLVSRLSVRRVAKRRAIVRFRLARAATVRVTAGPPSHAQAGRRAAAAIAAPSAEAPVRGPRERPRRGDDLRGRPPRRPLPLGVPNRRTLHTFSASDVARRRRTRRRRGTNRPSNACTRW